MKYSIKVNEVRAKEGSNIKGFATVVFGDSFKITNIAILENKDKGELFVSMPRYRSNERDESNFTGRTLFGAMPPKGQEMDDHYFGAIRERIAAYMRDVNKQGQRQALVSEPYTPSDCPAPPHPD